MNIYRCFYIVTLTTISSLSLLAGNEPKSSSSKQTRTISVSGQALDTNQKPIQGAVVISYPATSPRFEKLLRTETNGQGDFSLKLKLASDINRIHVKAYSPDHAIGSQVLIADKGADLTCDLTMENSTSVSFQVVDEDNQPIENARVVSLNGINQKGQRYWMAGDDWLPFGKEIPTSDPDGKLVIPNQLVDVPINLVIGHPEFAHGQLRSISPTNQSRQVKLERGVEVKFQVTCVSDLSAVSDSIVELVISTDRGNYIKTVPIGPAGTATTRLADRHATIHLKHPTLFAHPWYFYDHKEEQTLTFALHQKGTIRGRVLEQGTGKGVARMGVRAVADNRVIVSRNTDENGNYEMEVPDIQISITPEPTRSQQWTVVSKGQFLTVKPGEAKTLDDFVVKSKPATTGVVRLKSGEPVPRAIVMTEFREMLPLANDKGEFEARFRPYGAAVLRAFHPTQPLSATVSADQEAEKIDVVLAKEGFAYGMVVDEQGNRLAGIPVSLKARVRFESGGMSTILRSTTTREDGTFRFLSLSPGMNYRTEVRGKSRSSYSDVTVSHGDYRTVQAPEIRTPVVVNEKLLREVKDLAGAKPAPPARRPLLSGKRWFNAKPFTADELNGKSVLLCMADSAHNFENAQILHELYAPMGLVVVGIINPAGIIDEQAISKTLSLNGIEFPVVIGHGELFSKQSDPYSLNQLLYDSEGNFHSVPSYRHVLDVRTYMLYEHGKK